METTEHFKFFDPGYLTDGDLQLVLLETRPPIPEKGRVPEYKFEIRSNGTRAGNISFRTNLTEQLARYGGHIGYDVAPEFRLREAVGSSLVSRELMDSDDYWSPAILKISRHEKRSKRLVASSQQSAE